MGLSTFARVGFARSFQKCGKSGRNIAPLPQNFSDQGGIQGILFHQLKKYFVIVTQIHSAQYFCVFPLILNSFSKTLPNC
jgi:hypothetical protein